MLDAHVLGHFGPKTTWERVEEDFYWKTLRKDVIYFVERCLTCQRNERFTPLEHTAKVLQINYLFQRTGMDIVGGLPLTKYGYHMILVMAEYMSKLVKIYPIKTKSAIEVAEKLWLYISQFGPMSILISDCGTEFCNKVIKALADVTGIDRRITSPYNPRTDGLVERANQTITKILRKCAEADHDNWINWIPFVEYSYNTRKHSITKFSPFELLYGVQPNKFVDFNQDENQVEDEILFNRSLQLKTLIEHTREQALKNINEGQERQAKIQNNRTNPTEQTLKQGDVLMVKCEGLLGKLESRYHGRFFVKSQTKKGNYILLNILGKELERSYPITKLKPILEDESILEMESVEIEKILNKRKNNDTNKMEYLVKWKNLDETENEWVPEDHFVELKLINEYNAKIHRDMTMEHTSPIEQPKRRGRGRPKRVIPLMTILNLFLFIVICSANNEYETITVKDVFKKCDKSKSRLINLEENCSMDNEGETDFPELDTYINETEATKHREDYSKQAMNI